MFGEIAAQVAHGTQALVELDQAGGDVGAVWGWAGAGPGVVRRPLGDMSPVERIEQVQVGAGDGTLGYEGWQAGRNERDDGRWWRQKPAYGAGGMGQAVANLADW